MNINPHGYCTKCGSPKVSFPIDRFNATTGERETATKCSSDLCGHDGVNHEGEWTRGGRLFRKFVCRKCGATLDPWAHMQGIFG